MAYNIKNVSFVSGEAFEIEVTIPLTPFGMYVLIRHFDQFSFQLRVSYNGVHIVRQGRSPSNRVRHPSQIYFDYVLLRRERAVSVTLELPAPISDDEGIYELQILYDLFDVTQPLSSYNCSDYRRFLTSSDGLRLYDVLVGSTMLWLQNYGKVHALAF